MFTATFAARTQIDSEVELRSLFHSDRIYLSSRASVTFEGEVTLGVEVVFSGDCHFLGPTRIDNGSLLTNVRFGRKNVVRPYSILSDVAAGDGNLFGPFCFIRDNCVINDECILGATQMLRALASHRPELETVGCWHSHLWGSQLCRSLTFPATYLSAAYVGPFDEVSMKVTNTLLRSPPVLNAVLQKFPQYLSPGAPSELRRSLLEGKILFSVANGADPKRSSLYILAIEDTDPARARRQS